MASYAKSLGLDQERMHRRIDFLKDRATWHNRRETPLDRACAATALRDAAILALLLCRAGDARSFLRKAGQQWARLGLFGGYLLESFADEKWDFDEKDDAELLSRLSEGFVADNGERPPIPEDRRRPFEAASQRSPRQLLNLYEATGGRRSSGRAAFIRPRVASHLKVYAAQTVGVTGLPFQRYLALFDRLDANEPTKRDLDTLYSVAIRRREWLEAARSDQFHWRMILKPAELVDLDLVALGLAAFDAGGNSRDAVLKTVGDEDTATGIPFLLARDLRNAGELKQ